MSKSAYLIRNYRFEDSDKLAELGTEVQERGRAECVIPPFDFIESVGRPDHFSQGNLFVAEADGEIVGYADLKPELDIGRVVLTWLVHPKHRSKGLSVGLLNRAISRSKELGIMAIHVNVWRDSRMARQLLTRMGFTFFRRYFELRLDLSKTSLPEVGKIFSRCGPLQPGDEEKLTQLQNRSFMGSWGFHANAVEEIVYRINLPNCSPGDILLASESGQAVGYCWTRINFWENKASGEGTGRIYMLGVDPDYRGKGLGRQLLLAGLSYLKGKGLRFVELTVDRENRVARALYKSVGFKLWTSSLWYERRLEQACYGLSGDPCRPT